MFSELIDRAVDIAGRPDRLASIVYFANETIWDLSKREDWAYDLVEEYIEAPATGLSSIVWEPEVTFARFRRMEYVVDNCGCEPPLVRPSRRIEQLDRFYYQSGSSFAFKGCCFPIKVSYYAYPKRLAHYPAGQRPAVFDYASNTFNTADPALLDLVTNWILQRHNMVVLHGTLAKHFASIQDPRQGVTYSQYEQGFQNIIRAESTQALFGSRLG
jgi:hypothetical protein